MNIFDFFKNKTNRLTDLNKPKIEFGFRGEDIIYHLQKKKTYISFTWCNGDRLYSDSIDKWSNDSFLTNEERQKVFNDILQFLQRRTRRLIVVINVDDPLKDVWEHICSINKSIVNKIEYTSDEENYQFQKNMYLDNLKRGGRVIFGENEITNEKELDDALQKRLPKRSK